MGTLTPTRRSLKLLREEGWLVQIVEVWNPHARVRQDLFGIGDIIAVKASEPPTLIQVTSRGNVAARVTKIRANEEYPILRDAGWRVLVHGWGKLAAYRKLQVRIVDMSDVWE